MKTSIKITFLKSLERCASHRFYRILFAALFCLQPLTGFGFDVNYHWTIVNLGSKPWTGAVTFTAHFAGQDPRNIGPFTTPSQSQIQPGSSATGTITHWDWPAGTTVDTCSYHATDWPSSDRSAEVGQNYTTGSAPTVTLHVPLTFYVSASGEPIPPTPTGLTATPGDSRVTLSWNASSGATSYNVKRSTATGQETFLASTTGTSYADTGLANGIYYYVVSAVNPIGESANSSEVSATLSTIWTVAGNYNLGGTYSGDGSYSFSAGLNWPVGIAVDSSGNFYIADSGNNVIRKVSGYCITTVAANYASGATPPSEIDPNRYLQDITALNFPTGIAVDGSGNIYIADTCNNWIGEYMPFDPRTHLTDLFGLVGCYGCWNSGTGDGGPAIDASLNSPGNVAVDGSGNVYIADGGNNVIRKVDVNGIITTVAGNGQWGYSGNGGPATSASLYLCSGGYGVSGGGIAVDGLGNIYFADVGNNAIREVDSAGFIWPVAGGNGAGYSGDGGPATSAQLSGPAALALDSQGNLYIAEAGNNVIRKVDTSGKITTVAGDHNLGGGYSGDQGPAKSAALNHPLGVAVDSLGNLYISDSGNNVIRMVIFNQ